MSSFLDICPRAIKAVERAAVIGEEISCERLFCVNILNHVWEIANINLSSKQGDLVLFFLPLPGFALHARFSVSNVVEQKLSESNNLNRSSERRKKPSVCHINMLKAYVDRTVPDKPVSEIAPVLTCAPPSLVADSENGLRVSEIMTTSLKLCNLEFI